MQQNPTPGFVPLHLGRSFICYRDVNKAIEQHRELHGFRLLLKKATKLENYRFTVEQLKTLNFRLKYGELDYQCSIDNGRPGRPGNDERCALMVQIRLSPDARTLVVHKTHIHEYSEEDGYGRAISPPAPANMPQTIQLINSTNELTSQLSSLGTSPEALAASLSSLAAAAAAATSLQQQPQTTSSPTTMLSPTSLSILQKFAPSLSASSIPTSSVTIKSTLGNATPAGNQGVQGQLLIPSFHTKNSAMNNIKITSLSSTTIKALNSSNQITLNKNRGMLSNSGNGARDGSQKITMRLKKSQFSPNEMVVVGSARDNREQQGIRQYDRSTPRTNIKKSPLSGGRINAVVANLLDKVASIPNNSLSVTKLCVKSPAISAYANATGGDVTITYISQGISGSTGGNTNFQRNLLSGGTNSVVNKNMCGPQKQVLPQHGVPKVVEARDLLEERRLLEKLRARKTMKVKVKPLSLLHGSKPVRPVGRPLGSTNASRVIGPEGITNNVSNVSSNSSNNNVSTAVTANVHARVAFPAGRTNVHSGGGRGANVGRKMRKCRQRSQAAALNASNLISSDHPDKLLPLDTELGEGSKQRVAQGVLLQLLRTTTQLSMVEFSHAMETITTLTDALRLNHRVELAIHQEDQDNNGAFALLGDSSADDLSFRRGFPDPSLRPTHNHPPQTDIPVITLSSPFKDDNHSINSGIGDLVSSGGGSININNSITTGGENNKELTITFSPSPTRSVVSSSAQADTRVNAEKIKTNLDKLVFNEVPVMEVSKLQDVQDAGNASGATGLFNESLAVSSGTSGSSEGSRVSSEASGGSSEVSTRGSSGSSENSGSDVDNTVGHTTTHKRKTLGQRHRDGDKRLKIAT